MFRLTLISLFLAAASARELEFTSNEDAVRKLQFGDLNLADIAFNFGGINFSATEAQEACPNEFDSVFQCILKDCNNALDVCPDLTDSIPDENLGTQAPVVDTPTTETTDEETTGSAATTDAPETTDETMDTPMDATDAPETTDEAPVDEETMDETAAPTEGEDEDVEDEEAVETESPTATPEETGPGPEETGPGPEDAVDAAPPAPNATDTRWLQAVTTQPVPTCEELDELFCEFLGGEDTEGCCLTECTVEIQDLLVCYLKFSTGEDRADCEVPDCPTAVPAEPAATNAPVESGAATVTRVATLAASLLAFAVL